MTQTVYGILADATGLAANSAARWASAAGDYRRVQAERVLVDADHDGIERGEVVYLERNHGNLWCVAHVDDRVEPVVQVRVAERTVTLDHDLFWSAMRWGTDDFRDIVLDSVALTRTPARLSARPVRILPGMLDHRDAPRRWQLEAQERELLQRAAAAHLDRRSQGGPLIVVDHPAPKLPSGHEFAARSSGLIEFRSAELAGVSGHGRTIELVVAPAESPATVAHQGRWIREVFGHGAFAGAEKDPGRVRVNRDHVLERTVGVATRLDPWASEGLVGTIKLARTPLGDESLELARDGCLDASAGFRIVDDQWQGRSARRVVKAVLYHIALTPEPAYEDARVLAVRELVH